MKIFPYEKWVLLTALSREDILETLVANTSKFTLENAFGERGTTLFWGTVNEKRIKLFRNINCNANTIRRRNSFVPIIKVDLNQNFYGSEITFTFRLAIFVAIFMFFWLSGILFYIFLSNTVLNGDIVISSFPQNPIFSMENLAPMGMALFGMLLVSVPFWIEVKKAKHLLEEIFEQV